MAREQTRGVLTVHFEVSIKLKLSYPKKKLPSYDVRDNNCPLSLLYSHIKQHFHLDNDSSVYSVLPIAICPNNNGTSHGNSSSKVPLVGEELWQSLLSTYKYSVLKVVLERRPLIDLSPPPFGSLFQRTLKNLDVRYYIPEVLEHGSIISLGELIFHRDYRVKEGLRRGIWMHLLGVFHPALKTLEQREDYITKLRRMYDILKGKWVGDGVSRPPTIQHLYDSIQRDAIRTDPTMTFIAGTIGNAIDDNLQKLVEIVMIFVLEHGTIKYTQGMTDLLSPLLYVMGREDDAYICFAAMMEHIKDNFGEWCEGTLNKLERLKHLCEVLDPDLYNHLTKNMVDDPFILFFGMILIECRREFSFKDSLHLFEVLWSSTLKNDSPVLDTVSMADWASFMTTVSRNVTLEVFGETASPYSTQPLDESASDDSGNRSEGSGSRSEGSGNRSEGSGSRSRSSNTSQARQIPRPGSAIMRSGSRANEEELLAPCSPFSDVPLHKGQVMGVAHLHDNQVVDQSPRDRSASLPDSSYAIVSHSEVSSVSGAHSEGDIVKGDDEEGNDGIGELDPSLVVRRIHNLSHNTEMSDMSSVSSASNGILASIKSGDYSPVVAKKHGRKPTPRETRKHQNGFINKDTELLLPLFDGHDDGSHDDIFDADENSYISTVVPDTVSVTMTTENTPSTTQATIHTPLYEGGPAQCYSSTLPRQTTSHGVSVSSSLPNEYLRRLAVPSISSPYVSPIRPLDRIGMSLGSTHHNHHPTGESPVPCESPTPYNILDDVIREASSVEASIEVSHVMSPMTESTRPNVSRESSLHIKMANSFSIFVCLAILVKNRSAIMERDVDFVGLSVLLNNQTGSQNLSHILKIARQLHKLYRHYQDIVSSHKPHLNYADVYETWLDDPALTTPTTNTGTVDSNYGVN